MNNSRTLWVSRILSGVITLALIATAAMKIARVPKMVDGLTRAGIPETAIVPIALLELTCLAVYLGPRTRVVGAVLLTGYFGGAAHRKRLSRREKWNQSPASRCGSAASYWAARHSYSR